MKNFQKIYLRRAKIVAWLLQSAPFIRMVGLNGSLATGKAKEYSDIDFLIITKKDRIWTNRAFVTFMTHLTGLRRYSNKISGRICLNRYQTEDFVEIFPHNEYHARCFAFLVPLVDIDNTYNRYVKKNQWMRSLGYPVKISKNNFEENIILKSIRHLFEKILKGKCGNWMEIKLKNFQKRKILSDPRTLESPKGRVRISDKELCFHPIKDVGE
jgi:predicted nucleotidyltransferase